MSRPKHSSFKPAVAPWIQEIPAHWDEKPFYALMRERKSKNKGMKEDNLLSLSYGNIIRKDINTPNGLLPESFETYQIVEPNDVVFRLTDLQNDKRSLRSAICSERGIITSAYLAVRSEGILPAFMNYLMRAYDVQKVFYSMGGGLRQSLGYEDLRRMSIVAPPLEEQTAIARFLDRETARIDGLIEKKGRFIELLKEKRAAVITHAVTKGIDADVPMKDSGVEWIGQVPSHWKSGRLRDFSSRISTGPFGSTIKSSDYVYGGTPILNPSHYAGGVIQSEGGVSVTDKVKERLSFWALRPGDIIAARRGELGRCAIVGLENSGWLCGTGSILIRVDEGKVSPSYAATLIGSKFSRSWLDWQSVGTTMPNLNESLLGNLPLFVPTSLSEQDAILAHIDRETARIDGLISTTNRSIELLKEKRSALITAAVTGKIDVRSAA